MRLVRSGIIGFGLLCLLFAGCPAYAIGCVGANNVAQGSNVVSGAVVDSSCLGTKLPANGYITYTPAYPGAVPYCLINNSSNSYFVPGKSAAEWSAFENALANGPMKSLVTTNSCTGTVPNGYLTFSCPTCTINCNPGYTLSGTSCVCSPTCGSGAGHCSGTTYADSCGNANACTGTSTTGSCAPAPPPAPSCTSNCGNTNSHCSGTTYSDGCDGTCTGTGTTGVCGCTPSCSSAGSHCSGTTFSDGCNGTC